MNELSLILLVERVGGAEDEDEDEIIHVFGSRGPKLAPGRKKLSCCKKKCVEFFNIDISGGMIWPISAFPEVLKRKEWLPIPAPLDKLITLVLSQPNIRCHEGRIRYPFIL